MRLDIFLVENGYFNSRQKAQNAIKDGAVSVNGKIYPHVTVKDVDKIIADCKKEEALKNEQ